ncbi:hypothetical protein [Alteromonas facilis]|uniref:hypothetical protein n=1 Tax=Alteromonas facilis TaxID=2048004 RepID=UPI000C293014|nr:hypothetical protein [Alteromonas facilis]
MMKKADFSIQRKDRMISVKLIGKWTTSADLAYLTSLSQAINAMRRGTWGIIVDMRQWQVDESVAEENKNYPVVIDRRNQIAEAWLVNDAKQAQHLDKYFESLPFSPLRVQSQSELNAWANAHGLPLDSEYY